MDIIQIGIDHHLAPLDVRERLALSTEAARHVAKTICEEPWADEVLVLATCNRTELYVVTRAALADELVLDTLRHLLPEAPPADVDCYRRQRGPAAAQYLIRVAAGLESAMLGETEIQGQVRTAHAAGQAAGTVGPVLDRLCQTALRTGKRTRSETTLSEGGVSHGSAAVTVAGRVFGRIRAPKVLIVGAGVIATQAARAMTEFQDAALVVLNRTTAHAEALVADLGQGVVAPLDALEAHATDAHIAVFATGQAPLSHAALAACVAKRRAPLVLIDLGMPRAIDPKARSLPGVFLYDLEDLEGLVSEALVIRQKAVPHAERIVTDELDGFRQWYRGRRAAPALQSLRAWAEEIRSEETAFAAKDLDPAAHEHVERLTQRLVARLLGRAASRVARGAKETDSTLPTAEHLLHLFGLDESEEA